MSSAQAKLSIKELEIATLKKNQLELKIFKLKKGRIAKVFANCTGKPKEKLVVSVFNENITDARSIP